MTSNAQFTLWPAFLQALQTRFVPSQYNDPIGMLFKLTRPYWRNGSLACLLHFSSHASFLVSRPIFGGRCRLTNPSRWFRLPALPVFRRRRFPRPGRLHGLPRLNCCRPPRVPHLYLPCCRHPLDRLHLRCDASPRTKSPPAASVAYASLAMGSTTEGIGAPLGFFSW